jgi:hypothetical protein
MEKWEPVSERLPTKRSVCLIDVRINEKKMLAQE